MTRGFVNLTSWQWTLWIRQSVSESSNRPHLSLIQGGLHSLSTLSPTARHINIVATCRRYGNAHMPLLWRRVENAASTSRRWCERAVKRAAHLIRLKPTSPCTAWAKGQLPCQWNFFFSRHFTDDEIIAVLSDASLIICFHVLCRVAQTCRLASHQFLMLGYHPLCGCNTFFFPSVI